MKSKTIAALSLVLLFAIMPGPARAGTDMDEGIELYKKAEYMKARNAFEKVIASDPKSWKAHFYLGHIYLSMGKYASAKHEYSACENLSNDAGVRYRCAKALALCDKREDDEMTKKYSSLSSSHDDDAATSVDPAIERKRNELMNAAKNKCNDIKKAAESQIESEKANSNLRFRDGNGNMQLDIPAWRRQQIMEDADSKCKGIMDNAERSARTYH